jgi:hypothetical protein
MSSSGSVRLRYEKCLQVWGNATVYEGIRGDQKVKSDRSIPNANELPAYELYRQERETLKK